MARKVIIVVLVLLCVMSSIAAADIGIGLSFGATAPLMEVGEEVDGQYSSMLGLGGEVMLDFAYMPVRWFFVGASVGASVYETPYSEGVFWTVPAYVDVTIAPGGRVRFPITISGGAYVEGNGDDIGWGPGARASIGVETDIGNCTVYAKTQAETRFSITDDGIRTFISITPIVFGARMLF